MASSMKGFEHLEIQLEEIKSATNNFNEENVIGHGGFGKVYKGELSHSHSEGKSMVALKRLDRRHGQGDAEFYKEVRMLSCYRHENIISLLGFSRGRDEKILVYEYASRGSLDGYLKDVNLTWTQRLKICLDAAKGLSYLHDPRETNQRLIHCDIKSANILLDDNFNAKVADFGLSKICPANQHNSILVTDALGTHGYCDPVFMETYTLTKESDVYSFGVVLFEVLCGKLCVEYSKGQLKVIHVPMWKESYEEKKLDRIILEDIKQQMSRGSLETFSAIAYQCLKRLRKERPTMSLVVEKLEIALQMQLITMASFVTEFKHLEIQLEEIQSATNNFDESKVIGSGGFGKVYAGELSHSQSGEKCLVAIKRLDRRYGQGDPEFFKEIRMLSCYRHENLISLLGFCCQGGEMVLIYEYASHGSLDCYLSSTGLTWTQRLRICIEAAKGLCFLHDPNGTQQRVLHCDIKSANILLDKYMTAKVSDFGLSKMGPAHQQYSLLITSPVGTPGYCDPLYMQTYSLTKESDVYSFGVVLFEVMCGRRCFENSNGHLIVYVPFWRKCYEENKLGEIILQDIRQQMDLSSMKTFSDIASQCLWNAREERPTMSLVVEKLQIALQMQVLPEEYKKIANAAVDPLLCRSLEEFKELLSKGVLLNRGETWLLLNEKEEHHVMVSIEEYLSLDDPNSDYSDRYSSKEKSRFAVGCYKTSLMEFKLRVTAPLFLSPDVTYGLNLVLHASEIEGMKQQYVGVGYKLQGETKISILHFADKKEGKQLVAELYQFKSTEESILDLEIFLEDCGLSGDFYIEGIEFRPLEKMERQVVIANQEIVRGVVPPLFYRFTEEESKVLLSQGVLLNEGKTWLCINEKGEHIERIYIHACVDEIQARRLKDPSYLYIVNSRFPGGHCYQYGWDGFKCDGFKARVRGEYLTPQITYTLNLVFRYKGQSDVKSYSPLRYKMDGEAKVFIINPSTDMREDGWFIVPLYHFTTQHTTADLQFQFEDRWATLLIAGFEFQPSEEKVELLVFEEYQHIVEAASQSLLYTSLDELKQILSKGVHLNGYKTWFSLNEKGEHCEMISMKDCLIPNEDSTLQYKSHRWSRFPAGFYHTDNKGFKTHVKTQFLSPSVTYTVNLVFYFSLFSDKYNVDLKYILRGETKASTVYLTDRGKVEDFNMAELYQFTSDGSIVELEITFDNHGSNLQVEGILFKPVEKVEDNTESGQ